jgi:ATP-binding cassette subfamily B protein
MKLIQIFHREGEKQAEFSQRSDDLFQSNFREIVVYGTFRPLIYWISIVSLAAVLGFGGVQVMGGALSIGTLYIFTSYVTSFFEPIQSLSDQFGTLQAAMAAGEKIFALLDQKPMIQQPQDPKPLPDPKGRIEFDHVWFSYDGEEWVLRDVSFVIEPGQTVAFVGATGAGKSSILNLIGRYYDIQKGKITIDGVDIRELDLQALRRAVGQVQQDVFLFTGDIRGNIRLGNQDISDQAVEAAAEFVGADGFIRALEHGYEEAVTERGSTLSAGQRQLLSFARTLAYDPAILVMDEATANIDTETEALIQEAMARLMSGRTTIVVAHRLSTIQHADKIMVMHKGRLREQGTHQELLQQDGIYKKLYNLQLHQQ